MNPLWKKKVAAALALTTVGCILVCACRSFPLNGGMLSRTGGRSSLAQARLRILYKLDRGTFNVTRVRNSIRLVDMATGMTLGDRQYLATDKTCRNTVKSRSGREMVIASAVDNGPAWETRFEIRIHLDEGKPALDRILRESYGVQVTCRLVEPSPDSEEPIFFLLGKARTNRSTRACPAEPRNRSIAQGAPSNDCLCDRKKSCIVHLAAPQTTIGDPVATWRGLRFPFQMRFASACGIDFAENVPVTMDAEPAVPADRFAAARSSFSKQDLSEVSPRKFAANRPGRRRLRLDAAVVTADWNGFCRRVLGRLATGPVPPSP